MKGDDPLTMARLASVGFSLLANVGVGFVLGVLANKYLHWDWAIPLGIVVGFAAGFAMMFRQLR